MWNQKISKIQRCKKLIKNIKKAGEGLGRGHLKKETETILMAPLIVRKETILGSKQNTARKNKHELGSVRKKHLNILTEYLTGV